ncbi:MAG: 30S ribosomal protein S6 [Nitrospirae bacterium]|nr:30S ribosomal protein S6 [Nitrospirota bacterium]
MNIYESIIILNATLPDEDITAATEKIKNLITNSAGEILQINPWGRRKLAYEIKKHKKGFYLLLHFKSPSSLIKKLEDYYKVFDPVIKYMILKLDKKQIEAALQTVSAGEGSSASVVTAEQKTEA